MKASLIFCQHLSEHAIIPKMINRFLNVQCSNAALLTFYSQFPSDVSIICLKVSSVWVLSKRVCTFQVCSATFNVRHRYFIFNCLSVLFLAAYLWKKWNLFLNARSFPIYNSQFLSCRWAHQRAWSTSDNRRLYPRLQSSFKPDVCVLHCPLMIVDYIKQPPK